jgi:hypothetical protein
MSPRKPTIDDIDDVDDEDGAVQDEGASDSDLKLHQTDEQNAGLGRTPPGVDPYIEDTKKRKERE